jgi:hypothetical protein
MVPFTGVVTVIVGTTVSTVVKLHTNSDSRGLPKRFAALVLIVQVNSVSVDKLASGINVMIFPFHVKLPVAVGLVENAPSADALSIAVLKVTVMEDDGSTPVAPADGATEVIVGTVLKKNQFSSALLLQAVIYKIKYIAPKRKNIFLQLFPFFI